MLVDDDEDDQMIFASVVNDIDTKIDCRCYGNAFSSLKTLQTNDNNKPDCIFLDLNLPLMHGFEFLQLIKTNEDLHNIPVIIYSTSSREADKIKAKELGAFNYLSKQTSLGELKDKVTHLLSTLS